MMVKAIYVLPVYSAIYSNLPRLLNETQTSDTATVVAGSCLKLPVMLIIPVMFDCMQGGTPKKRSSLSKSVLIRLHSGSAEMMQHMGLSLICWKCACNTLSQGGKLRPFHIPEFSNLHFIGAPAFRRPQLGNLHLMEEHSVIRFYLKKAANIEENTVLKVINV